MPEMSHEEWSAELREQLDSEDRTRPINVSLIVDSESDPVELVFTKVAFDGMTDSITVEVSPA